MNYIVELTNDELKILKEVLKNEFDKMKYKPASQDFYGDACLESYKQHQLLSLLGKLDNIIPVVDKITDNDVSIPEKRKYGLFGRK